MPPTFLHRLIHGVALATLILGAPPIGAQTDAPRLPELNRPEIDRLASAYAKTMAHERAWVVNMRPLNALYRDLRQRGQSGEEATKALLRVGLPGVDIGPLGEKGQEARLALAQWVATLVRQDGLTEPAAVAEAYLDLNQALGRLVTAEQALLIHFEVERDAESPKHLRTERLQPREGQAITELSFTEVVDPKTGHACTVEATWHVSGNTKLVLSCKTKSQVPWRTATVVSECRSHPNQYRPLALALQADETSPDQRFVYLWCSSAPSP